MEHPLAINFQKLQQYDLSKTRIDEIIFFEWLILKRLSMGRDKFFYQNRRVLAETGLKKARLTSIKEKFLSYGLEIEGGGIFNTTHYTVTTQFVKSWVNAHGVSKRKMSLRTQINNFKFKPKEKNKKDNDAHGKFIIAHLTHCYNRRREKSNPNLSRTQLSYNNTTLRNLEKLSARYSVDAIEHAFIAFVDAILSGEEDSRYPLNNFTCYEPRKDAFPVFEYYLNIYNSSYEIIPPREY